MDKDSIRKTLLAKRRQMSSEDVQRVALEACLRLIGHPFVQNAKSIVMYAAFDNEVCIDDVIIWAIQNGKCVALPCFRDGEYGIAWISTLGDLAKGKYGILEPCNATSLLSPSEKEAIDLWIVPGVAFTQEGHRLGYGKGYLDRLMIGTRGKKIGVGYAFQCVEALPIEPHDVVMDEVALIL